MTPWVQPVTLARGPVRLEPLCPDHADGLAAAAADGELWKIWVTSVPDPGDEGTYPDDDLEAVAREDGWHFTHKDGSPY